MADGQASRTVRVLVAIALLAVAVAAVWLIDRRAMVTMQKHSPTALPASDPQRSAGQLPSHVGAVQWPT